MQADSEHPQHLPLEYAIEPRRKWRRRRVTLLVVVALTLVSWLAYRAYRPELKSFFTGTLPLRKWRSPEAMHAYFIERFVASDGFGGGRMPRTRSVARDQQIRLDGREYSLSGIDLISLAHGAGLGPNATNAPMGSAHAPATRPFVYEDPFTYTKTALQGSRRRELRPPEITGLARLMAGQQTVLMPAANQSVLIGAVRASQSCLKCHDVSARSLLGAFTYTLGPVNSDAE